VGKHANAAFGVLSLIVARSERGAQAPLVAGNSALDLPAIPIDALGEASFHLCAVLGRGEPAPSGVQGNDTGADAELLAAKFMVVFPVVGSVCQNAIDIQHLRRLPYSLGELGRIVAWPPAHHGASNQVRSGMTHERQLRPNLAQKAPVALPVNVVGADVARFQTSGVHGHLRALIDQLSLLGTFESGPEKRLKSPFFTSRPSA